MLLACLLLVAEVEPARFVFAERYDQAFVEARARNVPVVVLNFDGWASNRQSQFDAFFTDDDFREAAEKAVLVLASQEEHGSRMELVDGVEQEVCKTYGGTSCRNHRDMLPKVFGDFGKDGQLVSPLFGILLPDQTVVAHLEHEHDPGEIMQSLKEAAKKLGRGMPRDDYVRLQRGLLEIKRLADLNEFASAVTVAAELAKIPGQFPPQQELAVATEKLDAAGRKQMQRAEELWAAARHDEALLALDDVRASFGKLPVATAAATRMTEWERSAQAKPHLATLKADRAARLLYHQAVELDRKGDPKRARQALEKLAKAYPESRFTARGRTLLSALRGIDGAGGP